MSRSSLWMTGSLAAIALLIAAATPGAPPRSGRLNIHQALDRQQQLVQEDPYSASAQNDLGNLLILVGDVVGAEQAYLKGIELDPQNTGIYFNYGVMLQQLGRNREALTIFRQLLDIDSDHAWAHYQLGTLYAERHQRRDAIEQFARAFALDPQLSFADTNPHVIENPLAAESLLRAQRYRNVPGVNVPRQYDDPEQIAQWMLETEIAAEEGAPVASESADDRRLSMSGSGSPREGDEGGSGRRLTPEDLDQDSQLGQASGGGTTRRYSRSVTGGINRGRSGGSSVRLPRTTTGTPYTTPHRTTGKSVPPSRREIGSSARPESDRNQGRPADERVQQLRERFRNSRLSTGRLQLELLPADSAPERLAQLDTPAGW